MYAFSLSSHFYPLVRFFFVSIGLGRFFFLQFLLFLEVGIFECVYFFFLSPSLPLDFMHMLLLNGVGPSEAKLKSR